MGNRRQLPLFCDWVVRYVLNPHTAARPATRHKKGGIAERGGEEPRHACLGQLLDNQKTVSTVAIG